NYGITESMGIGFTVTWQGKIAEDFRYSITSGAGYENSRPIKADVAAGVVGTYLDPTGVYTRNRGTLGYQYEGMFRSREDVNTFFKKHPNYTIFGQEPRPGMLYYKDIRGPKVDGKYTEPDGKITEADQVWILPNRGFNKGISFNLRWKGLKLHLKTSFSLGKQAFVPSIARKQPQLYRSGGAFWANHWRPSNIDAEYPDPYWEDGYSPASSFWLKNASSFSISLINLSYRLSHDLMERIGL